MEPTKPLNPAANISATLTLLAISPDWEDRRSLESILDSSGWTVQGAPSILAAAGLMQNKYSLILCDRDLPDGSWHDVFRQTEGLETPPPVVVFSKNADRPFWAEVLNLGGYDVILKPFVKSEVTRVIGMALRCFQASVAVA
jgi:DNA-binding response OmpR family regulator